MKLFNRTFVIMNNKIDSIKKEILHVDEMSQIRGGSDRSGIVIE
jgi:hypothetical protein